MPYYTNRQGVIPNTMPDDSPGWILVSNPPEVPEGKELIWLNWEWVVRDPKPENREGYVWKFNHAEFKANTASNGWIEYEKFVSVIESANTESANTESANTETTNL